MLRGYRGIVAALGLVLAAHHPNAEAQPKQSNPQERSASALENIASRYGEQAKRSESSRETEQCDQGDDKRHSDLCAQWKAADAAADSAWWAAVGGFASASGTILVLIALYLAFRSNWIARDTAKRQLRAYVSVSDVSLAPEGPHLPYNLQGSVTFINTGETPAIDLEAALWVAVSAGSFLDRMPIIEHPISDSPSKTVLGAGLPQQITHVTQITGHNAAEIMSGDFTVVVHGLIRYRDIFGQLQETRYRSFQNAKTRETGTPIASCPDGNSMT